MHLGKHGRPPSCKCGETRPEEFYSYAPRKCKPCCRKTSSEYLRVPENYARHMADKRAARRADPEKHRAQEKKRHWRRFAVVTRAGYVRGSDEGRTALRTRTWDKQAELRGFLEKQGGACAICRVKSSGKRAWALDHDHACCAGPVDLSCGACLRGALCIRCNAGMGLLRDRPDLLRAAADYLEVHEQVQAFKLIFPRKAVA